MENMREREVLARTAPVEAREVAAAGGRKYRGVTYLKSGKCSAMISEPGTKKKLWLGTFPSAEVAACAYDLAAKRLQGDRAKTNFDYPPPIELIQAVAQAARPGRRSPVLPAPPPPAPPAAAPPAAPTPVPFEHAPGFSFKAPPREPAQFPAFPFLQDPSRLVFRTPTLAPETDTTCKITIVRSTPPKPFSFPAAVAASHRVYDPLGMFAPPIHIVVPEPVPASPAETCLSSTPDPKLTASASSSRPMASNGRHLMLKTPKIFSYDRSKIFSTSGPITPPAPRPSDEEFTGDNFTGINVPFYFTPPLDAGAPEASGSRRGGGWLDCNKDIKKEQE